MFSATNEVWHRKGVGPMAGGFYTAFRHGGCLCWAGPGAVVACEWSWAADKVKGRIAYARMYALYQNPEMELKRSEHPYGLLAGLGWFLDHAVLVTIAGHEKIPEAILTEMEAEPDLLADSNWIAGHGFECISHQLPHLHRADRTGRRNLSCPGCWGRVTLTFTPQDQRMHPRTAAV